MFIQNGDLAPGRGGLHKQVTISADNVAILYSTVHVLSCVHIICLLSDATNNSDTIRMVPVYNNSQ